MTREGHLHWCKERALEYLPDDPQGALASMFSDLSKHNSTLGHPGIKLGAEMQMAGFLSTATDVRRFIEGFN